ncbi:unnamed protein product [Rotaria sp. Silwood2]|nr:unnamed protein product [Rotaria sp. Silwood2]
MPENKQKTRVTVISVPRKHVRSNIRKKHHSKKSFNNSNLEVMSGISTSFDQYKSRILSPTSMCPSVVEAHEISSTHKANIINSKMIRSIGDESHLVSTASSFNKSLALFMNDDALTDSSRINYMREYQEQKSTRRSRRYTVGIIEEEFNKRTKRIDKNKNHKKKRRYIGEISPACSTCCCLSTFIGILLFLMSITALLVFLLTNKHITTTTTSTTSTSTTSTTSTSTTSTTATTTTTTTSTTSITSTSMTSTTPTPPCTPTSVGSASTLYTTSSGSGTSYTCFAYEWTSSTTGLVTLAFELRHDPAYWYLDDVSVYAGATQMLTNANFETGSLSPWVRTTPYGSCGNYMANICSSSCRSGSYCLCDGSNGCADRVNQQFSATAGQVYVVSFWLKSGSTGSTISAKVTLS